MTKDGSPISLFEIDWGREEVRNVVETVTRGGYWAKGPYIDEFETDLEQYLDVEHVLTVNSGTTALVAALEAAGIGRGDEVIVPSFTFIATANAVKLVGATPVFADIERRTYGLDPESVREAISEDTAAILPVHVYGTACRISELIDIGFEHDLLVIEDAAEAMGATYDDQSLGTFGDIGVLSFCQNKVLTTGEGGAVVTDDDEIARKVALYRSHGRSSADYFESTASGDYQTVGTNIRMADINAAIGCAQLDRFDGILHRRRQVARRYREGFQVADHVEVQGTLDDASHVYQLFTIELDTPATRSEVIEALSDGNIASKVYWDPPVHQTSTYENTARFEDLASTERVSGRVLSLPMHPSLEDHAIDRIVETVVEVSGG
jgi:perosamine synthetase